MSKKHFFDIIIVYYPIVRYNFPGGFWRFSKNVNFSAFRGGAGLLVPKLFFRTTIFPKFYLGFTAYSVLAVYKDGRQMFGHIRRCDNFFGVLVIFGKQFDEKLDGRQKNFRTGHTKISPVIVYACIRRGL